MDGHHLQVLRYQRWSSAEQCKLEPEKPAYGADIARHKLRDLALTTARQHGYSPRDACSAWTPLHIVDGVDSIAERLVLL